jgi:hypothetical protein
MPLPATFKKIKSTIKNDDLAKEGNNGGSGNEGGPGLGRGGCEKRKHDQVNRKIV